MDMPFLRDREPLAMHRDQLMNRDPECEHYPALAYHKRSAVNPPKRFAVALMINKNNALKLGANASEKKNQRDISTEIEITLG